jgi:hypothetical protein
MKEVIVMNFLDNYAVDMQIRPTFAIWERSDVDLSLLQCLW